MARIWGTGAVDRLFGTAWNDTLQGLRAGDLMWGEAVAVRLFGIEAVSGGIGDDTIRGTGHADLLQGFGGNDRILGRAGNDRLTGGSGDDLLLGGSGHDTLQGGDGHDTLDGGAGIDRADYSDLDITSAVWFTLQPFRFPVFQAGVRVELFPIVRSFASDTLSGIEDVTGSRFADAMWGSATGNELLGFAGDDRLVGLGGADFLVGGAGSDQLEGGAGNDVLRGGAGADLLLGGEGNDRAVWDDPIGTIVVSFSQQPRRIFVDGPNGWNDGYGYPSGLIEIRTASGTDLVAEVERFVFAGREFSLAELARRSPGLSIGDERSQLLVASATTTTIVAMGGDDTVAAGPGPLTASGGSGNDRLGGGAGADRLLGDEGDDVLSGAAGNDRLEGGEGADTLEGGAGNDVLSGGSGPREPLRNFDSTIDTVRYASSQQRVQLDLSLEGVAQDTRGAGIDTLSGFEQVEGSRFDDVIHGFANQFGEYDLGKPIVLGGAGNDRIVSGAASEILDGGAGFDRYVWTGFETPEQQFYEQVLLEVGIDRLDLTAFSLAPESIGLEAGFAPGSWFLTFEGFAVELLVADPAFQDAATLRAALFDGSLLL